MKQFTYIGLILLLTSCLKEEPLKKEYSGFRPLDIGDNWTIGDFKTNQVDSIELNEVFNSIYDDYNTWPMRSLLVFRNDQLIAESYLKDEADRTNRRAIWSCTKQVMGLLAGFLLEENIIFPQDRLEQLIERYLPEHPDKKNITVDQLLTMKSGIGFHNDEHLDVLREKQTSNSIEFVLSKELEAVPGSRFNYNDGDAQLFSAVVKEMTGKSAASYAQEKLFSKIGMTNIEWISYLDGLSMGGFGIMTSPREMAKIGQFVLNKGEWDTIQVLSEEYINEMISAKSTVPDYPQLKFGNFWWIHPNKNYYIMWGQGGQYVFVMPDKNALVVITSLEQVDSEFAIDINKATGIVDRINKCLN